MKKQFSPDCSMVSPVVQFPDRCRRVASSRRRALCPKNETASRSHHASFTGSPSPCHPSLPSAPRPLPPHLTRRVYISGTPRQVSQEGRKEGRKQASKQASPKSMIRRRRRRCRRRHHFGRRTDDGRRNADDGHSRKRILVHSLNTLFQVFPIMTLHGITTIYHSDSRVIL